MSNDIALFLKETCFDINVKSGDLETDAGLETSVAISLFTDKRVGEDDLPIGQSCKRGWWGDMVPEIDQDQIGSRLWLITKAKRTQETLNRANELHREALDWMIEDGVADSVTVVSSYDDAGQLIAEIEISKPAGNTSRFLSNWDAQELRRL